ncbi:PP0621 family protein [Ramlibacter sp.]|uniref:PP0621 family protein n=1 Tax=Ramlibacter sp. TaxID=1917967 RepID=UPI003D0A7584
MKYLVLLAVLVVAYVWWRNGRIATKSSSRAAPGPRPVADPQDMIRCPVCSVHLPRGDAVADAGGRLFCSQEHRLRGGDAPSP